jgi:hypothetical protein
MEAISAEIQQNHEVRMRLRHRYDIRATRISIHRSVDSTIGKTGYRGYSDNVWGF